MTLDDDLLDVFERSMTEHPRSLQVELGPSEYGDPCARKLGFKLLQVDGAARFPGFASWVGTACHERASRIFLAENERLGRQRWLTDLKVQVGTYAGQLLAGHLDLYDVDTAAVIDFKFVGITSMRNYRANGLSKVYTTQVHGYGQGAVNAGLPVERVGCLVMPQNGNLNASRLFLEPFDPTIVKRALKRLEGIALAVRAQPQAVEQLPITWSYCVASCPFFDPSTTDFRTRCPGAEDQQVRLQTPALTFSGGAQTVRNEA